MQTISAKVFERAASKISVSDYNKYSRGYCCHAMKSVGSNNAEDELFRKMHQPRNGDRVNWFGPSYIAVIQRKRKNILREVALNLRAQGFVK